MEGRRSVTDIWKELQAATGPKGRLPGVGALSYVQQRVPAPRQGPKAPSFIGSLQPAAKLAEPTDAILIQAISAKLLGPTSPESMQLLQDAITGPLLVPLIRLLADPAEKCRELGVGFLSAAVQRLADAGGLVPTLVPAVAERMGITPVDEPSEEIRLLLVQLVGDIVERHVAVLGSGSLLNGVLQVLCRGLEDSYPDIKKVACNSLVMLAGSSCASQSLEPHLDALLSALLPNLQHQHSRVRLVALEALHALVMTGLRYQVMEERVAPAVQPLVHDHAANVRATVFASSAQWMGHVPQRAQNSTLPTLDSQLANQCRSRVPLFLPILMLGLTDELPANCSEALQQVEGVAQAYRTSEARAPQEEEDAMMEIDEARWPGWDRAVSPLPGYSHPFQARPSFAARTMIQTELSRLMPLVTKGLTEWTISQRAAAARLLHTILIYAESSALQYLPAVLQSMRSAMADEDATVLSQALAAAHVLGVNVPAKHWAPFVVEAITGEQLSMTQRVSGLHVLSAVLHAAGSAGQPAEHKTIQLLATSLGHNELIAVDHAQTHAQLLAAICNLLVWGNQQCSGVALDLLQLLLQISAAEHSRAATGAAGAGTRTGAMLQPLTSCTVATAPAQLTAAGVMADLAVACALGSAQQLCDQLSPRLLSTVCQDHEAWHSMHPNWRVFSSLLRCCGSSTIISQAPAILAVLQPLGAGHDKDPELRLAALVLVDELLQDDSKAAAWPGGLGVALADQVLLPAMVWRAGNAATAARYAALTAVATMLGKGLLPESALLKLVQEARLLPLLRQACMYAWLLDLCRGVVMQCLEEDYMAETRQLACHVLEYLLRSVGRELTRDQVQDMCIDLLRRLDDSSNSIRIAACGTLLVYISSVDTSLVDGSLAGQLAGSMVVHMDDADPAVQEAACAVLEAVAKMAPSSAREQAAATAGVHRSRAYIERVLAACGSAC